MLQRGLVGTQSLVEDDLAVIDASRRNTNFKVVREQGTSYLIKQGVGPERAATVDNEAAVYRLLHAAKEGTLFRPFLPEVLLHSPDEHILVLELLKGARHLGEYHLPGRFSTRVAVALGKALGALHSIPMDSMAGEAASIRRRPPPLMLSIHRPTLRFCHEISSANLELVRTVQRFPEFGERLDGLGREWLYTTLVHYDIKWENVLISRGRNLNMKIVDWELAGLGDPCWDVGAMFGEYLSYWLLSIPITGTDPPDRFLELARYPLVTMQPAMRAFWQAYTATIGISHAGSTRRLMGAVRYAAVRLLQTAFEQSQEAVQLSGNALCFLQVSLNMMQRPMEAAVHLLNAETRNG
jgi:aminoglycoside phosphotransferase (APT) family kinase protein